MLMLYERRESGGTLIEERSAYLLDQLACYAPSPVFGRDREAIDVAPPSVPSTDHGTNDPTVGRRDKQDCARFLYQARQTLD
jgi:hypothetical protein